MFLYQLKKRINQLIEQQYINISNADKKYGLENIGTHFLRKTFGYHFYIPTKDVVLLMEIYGHCDPSVTLRYIRLVQEVINETVKRFVSFSFLTKK
jgi:site-specific recombinase XerD